jgi:formylmethanofuran dehydrogenase subunit E
MTDNCTKCGKKIHGFLTGKKKIDGKPYCKECYYQELGEVVEKYPIGSPLSLSEMVKKQHTPGTKNKHCTKCGDPLSEFEEESETGFCFHCYVEMNT